MSFMAAGSFAGLSQDSIANITTNWTSEASKITSDNVGDYYNYAITATNTVIMDYISSKKLMSNLDVMKGYVKMKTYSDNALKIFKALNNSATVQLMNDVIVTDADSMSEVIIFRNKPDFAITNLISTFEKYYKAGEYGVVVYAYTLVKDTPVCDIPTSYRKFLDNSLVNVLKYGHSTFRYPVSMFIGYNTVVSYACESIEYGGKLTAAQIISYIDRNYYLNNPFLSRHYSAKDVAVYCNDIFLSDLSRHTTPEYRYLIIAVSALMDKFYQTEYLDKMYTTLTGVERVKVALAMESGEKITETLTSMINSFPTTLSYRNIRVITYLLTVLDDDYKKTERLAIMKKIDEIYSPNIEKDADKWESVIASVRALIEELEK